MKKTQILKQTLGHLNRIAEQAGMSPYLAEEAQVDGGESVVALVSVQGRFNVRLQAWAPQQDFSVLLQRVKSLPADALLLADFVNPVMAEKFRQKSIAFIDCAGNMNLRTHGLHVFTRGNRDVRVLQQRSKGRAFNPAGIKLLYAFFNAPALLNASYRTIASEVNVALGSIGPVLDDLQASGYIADIDGEKSLVNKPRLFERWVDAYLEKLRPGLLLGRYQSPANNWWQSVEVKQYGALWGGEITVARQTPFMLPEQASVYLCADELESFVQDCQLQPEADGDVTLYQAFNCRVGLTDESESVNAMIVYADLVDSIDPGNWEVAKTFYGDAIADLLKS